MVPTAGLNSDCGGEARPPNPPLCCIVAIVEGRNESGGVEPVAISIMGAVEVVVECYRIGTPLLANGIYIIGLIEPAANAVPLVVEGGKRWWRSRRNEVPACLPARAVAYRMAISRR